MSDDVFTWSEMGLSRTRRHMLVTMQWAQGSCFVRLEYRLNFTVNFCNVYSWSLSSLRGNSSQVRILWIVRINTSYCITWVLILYEWITSPLTSLNGWCMQIWISAAAALGALYYYVLAHQADFDVCWPCKGSVAEVIFKPWLELINSQGCRVLGNNRVVDVIHDDESNKITGIVASKSDGIHLWSVFSLFADFSSHCLHLSFWYRSFGM